MDDVISASCHHQASEVSSLGTQTFQAFADSLARILRDFHAHLSHLERQAAEQGKSLSDHVLHVDACEGEGRIVLLTPKHRDLDWRHVLSGDFSFVK